MEVLYFHFLVFGLKATVMASVAVSVGGVIRLSAVALVVIGALMRNSIKKYLGGWCGVALLWRPGGCAPPYRESAPKPQ
jgi:hypothetical protein